jgi:hypothetical protein
VTLDAQPSTRTPPAAPPARTQRARRHVWRAAWLVLAVLLLAGGWLGVRAVLARRALIRAQAGTEAIRADLVRGDPAAARTRLAGVRRDTGRARALTGDPLWRVASALPGAGNTFRAVQGLAAEADTLATGALPHFVAVGEATSGGGLRNGDQVDLAALRLMHGELDAAAGTLAGVVRRTGALPTHLLPGPVAEARRTLLHEVDRLSQTTVALRDATAVAPSMLGGDGRRRYFLALQTGAELRGSGGLLGGFGILEADQGRLRLVRLGPNKALQDTYPVATAGLDAEFAQRYARFGADGFWLNSNMSAHFPTVNRIWTSMYERTTGERLDGSIAVDAVALAEILKATGPATLAGGEQVTAETIVELTGKGIYERFPHHGQDATRDRLQLAVAQALYDRVVAPVSHDGGLLPSVGAAASSGHVRMASNHPAEQAVLAGSPVGGALPGTPGPYLQLAINNAGGTKLDYYLRTAVDYSFDGSAGDRQDVTVTLRLSSDAPASGLPSYVVLRPDLPGNAALVPGQNRLYVSVYAGVGATLRGAALDGDFVELEQGTEQGHSVYSAFVTLDPGQERTLVLGLTEPGTERTVAVVTPPTVLPASVTVVDGSRR